MAYRFRGLSVIFDIFYIAYFHKIQYWKLSLRYKYPHCAIPDPLSDLGAYILYLWTLRLGHDQANNPLFAKMDLGARFVFRRRATTLLLRTNIRNFTKGELVHTGSTVRDILVCIS